MADRYFARSASDRTDEWTYWFVADRQKGNLNVTVELWPCLKGYLPFLSRDKAIALANSANAATRANPQDQEGK